MAPPPEVEPLPRPKQTRAEPALDRGAYSIPEFCAAHRFSRSHYYALKRRGLGPAETRLGIRVVITIEAAIRWRKARGRATAA
jgi:hypothetical protein